MFLKQGRNGNFADFAHKIPECASCDFHSQKLRLECIISSVILLPFVISHLRAENTLCTHERAGLSLLLKDLKAQASAHDTHEFEQRSCTHSHTDHFLPSLHDFAQIDRDDFVASSRDLAPFSSSSKRVRSWLS